MAGSCAGDGMTGDFLRCEHDSCSGVDQTPLDDPAKLWSCHWCGAVLRHATEDGLTLDIEVEPGEPWLAP